jgi:hypothetical protein
MVDGGQALTSNGGLECYLTRRQLGVFMIPPRIIDASKTDFSYEARVID